MGINGVKVAVTGVGMLSPLGRGEKAFVMAKDNYSSSITNNACSLSSNDYGANGELSKKGWRATLLALVASRMALEQAFPFESEPDRRTGVIFGTSLIDLSALERYLAAFRQDGPQAIPTWALHYGLPLAHASHVAVSLRLKGMCETLNDPITAGISAVGMGYRVVALGEECSLLAGGVDSPSDSIFLDSLAETLSVRSFLRPAEGCAVFHLQAEEPDSISYHSKAAAYICGYAKAFTEGKRERNEALIQRLAKESFPGGEGVDLLLDTANLPDPIPRALAGGSSLACGLAISLMDKPVPEFAQKTAPSLLPLRSRNNVRRVIVTAEGPAGDCAAIAFASCRESSKTRMSRRYVSFSNLDNNCGITSRDSSAADSTWAVRNGETTIRSIYNSGEIAPRAFITGIGIASPIGVGRDAFYKALISGTSGVVRYVPPGLEGAGPSTAALVPYFPTVPGIQRSTQLAFAATEEALLDAGLNDYFYRAMPGLTGKPSLTIGVPDDSMHLNKVASDERIMSYGHRKEPMVGLYLGETLPSMEAMKHLEEILREGNNASEDGALADALKDIRESTLARVAKRFGLSGEVLTFGSGCTGGLFALGRAARDVLEGTTSLILAGSSESNLFPFAFGVLSRAKLLTSCPNPNEAGRPFDEDRDGEVTAEGSVMFVVEHPDSAVERGAEPYAIVSGFGTAGDAYHFKYNKLDGESLLDASKMALNKAGLDASEIDLVIAHASGFKRSDAIEVRALANLFSGCETFPPVISIKGATGQAFSAGGLFQVAAALCALEKGIIPPTAHFKQADEDDPFDHVPTARKAEVPIRHILITSYGYGGGKAALVLSAHGKVR